MVVYDCCPVVYAPLVTRPPSCSQTVVLLRGSIVTSNRHAAPLLPRRSDACHSMHRVVHALRGVAVSFDRSVRTCRHAVGTLLLMHHPSGKTRLGGGCGGRWSMRRLKRFLLYWRII